MKFFSNADEHQGVESDVLLKPEVWAQIVLFVVFHLLILKAPRGSINEKHTRLRYRRV